MPAAAEVCTYPTASASEVSTLLLLLLLLLGSMLLPPTVLGAVTAASDGPSVSSPPAGLLLLVLCAVAPAAVPPVTALGPAAAAATTGLASAACRGLARTSTILNKPWLFMFIPQLPACCRMNRKYCLLPDQPSRAKGHMAGGISITSQRRRLPAAVMKMPQM
jgi:hypothetical protein